ncbi:MAG TPA: hypothetical protein DCS93_15860 [Microscillaceae bacterium]|nr:hypothetical protein [Microscillaceae bacterium]
MNSTQANTIDEVISMLEDIIVVSKEKQDPLGYFAALYQKVTIAVKEGIKEGRFENGERMEKLDVIFANRYLLAYHDYQANNSVTKSWLKAFALSKKYWPVVLQHLLIGMNAHINLDLGIAAAEVAKGQNIEDLKNDFDEINKVLASLVETVQAELAQIWRPLRWILKLTGRLDNLIVDFSMELARDGAWRFAKKLAEQPAADWPTTIEARDNAVANVAKIVTKPGIFLGLMLKIVRLGERGTVSKKIEILQ